MTDFKSLRIESQHDAIAELVLIGPGRGNAMGPDFWRELRRRWPKSKVIRNGVH